MSDTDVRDDTVIACSPVSDWFTTTDTPVAHSFMTSLNSCGPIANDASGAGTARAGADRSARLHQRARATPIRPRMMPPGAAR
jgi:hypothetical protein